MSINVAKELARLERMTIKQLKNEYAEVFGDETKTNNKRWLVKRILWRLQMLAEGDLSQRAKQRAEEIANDADLRVIPPTSMINGETQRTTTQAVRFQSDERLPPPGTILTRRYKKETVQVRILSEGFEHEGEIYNSLSAVAKAITGSHCNGYQFFRLGKKGQA